VRELAARQIPLEVCFTSEVQTGALQSYHHAESLRRLLDAGCLVTINSDNCSVSNTWAARELVVVAEALGLTQNEVDQLLLNAVEASFADEATKERLREVVGR
jgi:adenosine deaminase